MNSIAAIPCGVLGEILACINSFILIHSNRLRCHNASKVAREEQQTIITIPVVYAKSSHSHSPELTSNKPCLHDAMVMHETMLAVYWWLLLLRNFLRDIVSVDP